MADGQWLPLDRREALKVIAGAAVAAPAWKFVSAEDNGPVRSQLGLVIYCCRLLREQRRQQSDAPDLYDPFEFLTHCETSGAGGMQAGLGVMPAERCEQLRARAAESELFVEAIIRLPRDSSDVSRFDAEMETARRAGAAAVRTTIIPGRRYEYFDSLEMFREFERRGRESLERAVPIAEKHRLPLAVENHKDQRNAERVALLEHISSEYVGACVDTGNSFALLEDPLETVQALAPWAHSVHLKDQAVMLYEEGFLLGDIPLGQGFLDLKAMVENLQSNKPEIHFSLELITRDALKVPCLAESYWAPMDEIPARVLARTLRQVRDGTAEQLPQVNTLPLDEQVALETDNVRESLRYARQQLGL